MRCEIGITAGLLLLGVAPAQGDTRLVTAAIVAEPGQAAPSIAVRNIATDGRTWELRVDGWTASAAVERPVERGRRVLASVSATPYSAHGSRRMFEDGKRAEALEFDAASYVVRGGIRFRTSERLSTEFQGVVGYDVIGAGASRDLREAWKRPYAGVVWAQRYGRVTAWDPFDGGIHGIELASEAEVYGGQRTWSRLALKENAGRPLGRFQIRQSASLLYGMNLDAVSSFLVGGSWDVLGPTAVYGTHYGEYRVERGMVASAGVDYQVAPRWRVGARTSALRAPSLTKVHGSLQTTVHAGGIRVTLGVAPRRVFYASVTGAAFQW